MKKVLAMFAVGIFLCGCQGPQLQQGIDGLKGDIDALYAQVTAGDALLTAVADMEKKAGEKLSGDEKIDFLAKVGELNASVAGITALKSKAAVIKDSLSYLEDKATGKTRDEAAGLSVRVVQVFDKIAAFSDASKKLDGLKEKFEVKEVKKEAISIKPKKAPPPAKKK
jgi:hypothetical protein